MKKSIIIIIAVVAVLLIAALGSFYVVAENEYACISRFSEIVSITDTAGLHMKLPFIDTVRTFPKTTLIYDIPPSEVLTEDKKNMTVDSYILWEISDPLKFYRTLGNTTEAESRLDAVTYNALKTLMGQHQQADIINQDDAAERNDIFVGLTDKIAKLCEAYGIKVLDVRIKRFDLAQSNEESVYLRMISERKKEAAQYTSEGEYEAAKTRNAADKDANTAIADAKLAAATLEAEGEAEYMEIISGIYDTESKREFYEFTLSLDALAATLDGNDKTVIIDKNSTIGQLLLEPGEPTADITDEDMPSDTADDTENTVADDRGVENDGEPDTADADANESEDVEAAA